MPIESDAKISDLLDRLKVLNINPFVAYVDGFRKADELANLITSVPDSSMVPAGFFDPKGEKGGQNLSDQTRKALHKGFKFGKNEMLDGMRQDVSAMFGVSPEFGEPSTFIRYGVGGEYKVHFDTWPFEQIKGDPKEIALGPRFFTGIVYLNDDFEGGSTTFPHLSLEISPKAGRLVMWSNSQPGTIAPHPLSAHAGMPVTSGEKNIVTFWLRTSQGADMLRKRIMDENILSMKLQAKKP